MSAIRRARSLKAGMGQVEEAKCSYSAVMPGFMPDLHACLFAAKQGVDGRDKPGHDG